LIAPHNARDRAQRFVGFLQNRHVRRLRPQRAAEVGLACKEIGISKASGFFAPEAIMFSTIAM